ESPLVKTIPIKISECPWYLGFLGPNWNAIVPVITLTSDIGLQDYMVGAIKGMLIQTCPKHQVIDISHDIIPFNFPQAAYICRSALRWFPLETCHFILV